MLNYYSWWVGGGWVGQKKTKLMLYSTLVEIEVEVGVELGNMLSVGRKVVTEVGNQKE